MVAEAIIVAGGLVLGGGALGGALWLVVTHPKSPLCRCLLALNRHHLAQAHLVESALEAEAEKESPLGALYRAASQGQDNVR